MPAFVQQLSVWALPILAAVILHEVAHGWVANRLGDSTAARAGRLTINPLPHIDPVGTVVLPLLLIAIHAPFVFGWARPVPVNFLNLRRPKQDMVKVAMAGPVTNLVLAVLCAGIFRFLSLVEGPGGGLGGALVGGALTPMAHMALNGVLINLVLAVFNMLPILPLDGGRVLAGLLPRRQAQAFSRLEPYGMLIVIALLVTDSLGVVLRPVITLLLSVLLS